MAKKQPAKSKAAKASTTAKKSTAKKGTTSRATRKTSKGKKSSATAAKSSAPKASGKSAPAKNSKKSTAGKATAKKSTTGKSSPKKTAVTGAKKATASKSSSQTPTKAMEGIMSQGKNQFDKIAQEAQSNGREAMESSMKSCGIMVKGLEGIVRMQASFAQNFAEKQMRFFNDAIKVKTINEWSEIQNSAAQETFNDLMDIATKMSEQCVKLASEAFEPVNDQINKSIKKANESISA